MWWNIHRILIDWCKWMLLESMLCHCHHHFDPGRSKLTKCIFMKTQIWVNISSGESLPGGTKHYLNQCWLIIINGILWHSPESHFVATAQDINSKKEFEYYTWNIISTSARGQWINSLWPSDAIWRQESGSTLAQVMACCLTATSHYLNQYWLIISEVQWHSY